MAWRDTARPAVIGLGFIKVDASLSFFLLIFLFHIKEWTAILSVSMMLLFGVVSMFGLSTETAFLMARAFLGGGKRRVVTRPWMGTMQYFFGNHGG